jgi:hypothetical protein
MIKNDQNREQISQGLRVVRKVGDAVTGRTRGALLELFHALITALAVKLCIRDKMTFHQVCTLHQW